MGWDIKLTNLEDGEMKILDAVDFINRRASRNLIAGKLAQLRATMARAKENKDDMRLLLATYADHLAQYPPDVVCHVIDEIITTEKWFPQISELIRRCDKLMSFRKSLLTALKTTVNKRIT